MNLEKKNQIWEIYNSTCFAPDNNGASNLIKFDNFPSIQVFYVQNPHFYLIFHNEKSTKNNDLRGIATK